MKTSLKFSAAYCSHINFHNDLLFPFSINLQLQSIYLIRAHIQTLASINSVFSLPKKNQKNKKEMHFVQLLLWWDAQWALMAQGNHFVRF